MNYQKIYDDICKRGQERELPKEVYTEKHHIIPKCLGGDNSKENLTKLTAREHFLVHYILTRIYPDSLKIWHACFKMCQIGKKQQRSTPNSKLYEEIKTEWNKLNRGPNHHAFGKPKTEDHKRAMSLAQKGRTFSDETKRKMSIAQQGKKHTLEQNQKAKDYLTNNNPNSRKCVIQTIEFISLSEASRYFNISVKVVKSRMASDDWAEWNFIDDSRVTENTRQKLREKQLGKKHSEESKRLMSERNSGENNPFYGRQHSDESKQKNSEAHSGKSLSCEHKLKIKESIVRRGGGIWKGVCGEDNPNFGRKHSAEFCQAISERQSGENNSFYGKHHTPETIENIRRNNKSARKCSVGDIVFHSMLEASRYFEIPGRTAVDRFKSNNPEWTEWKLL